MFIIIVFVIIVFFYYYCKEGRRDLFFFVHARFTFFHTHFSYSLRPFILFHSWCAHARVFGKPVMHEFPISYGHTIAWFTTLWL